MDYELESLDGELSADEVREIDEMFARMDERASRLERLLGITPRDDSEPVKTYH